MAWWPGAGDADAAQFESWDFHDPEEVGAEYVAFGPVRPCTISLVGIVDIGG